MQAAAALTYRDFLTVALVLDRPQIFPDNWIYIHSPEVRVARIQNFGNWSPAMLADPRDQLRRHGILRQRHGKILVDPRR